MMTGACHQAVASGTNFPPIAFFYSHLHDSIRSELQTLSDAVLHLESCDNLSERLRHLKERYRFLGQVYKYHSSVEDEVVYPALDLKVKNVTLAYSVEHEDEEQLFVQLSQLLSKALQETGKRQATTVRQLACKVEEIHITLRKHLAKEEEQLLPLLLRHFSFGEQAELVAQFLCCIPLSTVQQVVSWLKTTMPHHQQAELQFHMNKAVSDRLLQQLLFSWLQPKQICSASDAAADSGTEEVALAAESGVAIDAAESGSEGALVDAAGWSSFAAAEAPATEAAGETGSTPRTASAPPADGLVAWPARQLTKLGSLAPAGKYLGCTSCDTNSSTSEPFVCCREAPGNEGPGWPCRFHRDLEDGAISTRPPLREILYFHQAIRSALASFAEETRVLRDAGREGVVTAAQLQALVERHRFIRAVCLFHSASEDEVVFPALRKVTAAASALAPAPSADKADSEVTGSEGDNQAGPGVRHRCEVDHAEESNKFEELGRLLGDVRSCARRGAKDVAPLLDAIAQCAEGLSHAIMRHMAREEAEVLPLLMRTLCFPEQRYMIWRILRAMPLRLLERVMPWVAGKMRDDDVAEWLHNLAASSRQEDAPLVQLIMQWARRGRDVLPADARQGGRRSPGSDDPSLFSNQTCGPASFVTAVSVTSPDTLPDTAHLFDGLMDAVVATVAAANHPRAVGEGMAGPAVSLAEGEAGSEGGEFDDLQPPLKRIRTEACSHHDHLQQGPGLVGLHHHHRQQQGGLTARQAAAAAAAAAAETPRAGLPMSPGSALGGSAGSIYSPIDHIFQFHKALRRELKELESAAAALQLAADNFDRACIPQAISELAARFSFLRGIYRAHSKAEDEIVFPALESKEALHNVSHAYSLDHQKEEQLFDDLGAVMDTVRRLSGDLDEMVPCASQLSRMCAAVRASLETHVRAEERQLWPLFAEHFSAEEQEGLIGQIIGQTGAEVLHSMLSWVRGAMSQEEQDAMLDTMKAASKSTAFEQWLGVAMRQEPSEVVAGGSGSPGGQGLHQQDHGAGHILPTHQEEMAATLAEVAQYLAKQDIASGTPVPTDPAGIAADSSRFRPGWEDIFRMNQKQLEAAVRRVSTDQTLEPQRKAYLIQNIMASRYIVAQQKRMASAGNSAAVTPTAAAHPAPCCPAPQDAQRQQQQQAELPAVGGRPQGGEAADASPTAAVGPPPPFRCYHNAATSVMGCKHYKRRCQLVAPCCNRAFVCRLCHDEACDHQVDRHAVAEMVCMECGTRQQVAGSCSHCGTQMARYYCSICHLFDDEPGRNIYHCPFCNFCRQGKGLGIDSFHCMSCNACMSLDLFRKHRCKEQSLKGNCPVCSDPLFESKYPVKELPCGHFMHSHCFAAYTRYSYTCPICFKSLGDMSVYWQMIDSLVAAERLPMEYASRKQAVLCNDCGATTQAPFHFVYHKCDTCASYNTRVL